MLTPRPPDHPPLLQLGFHSMRMDEVQRLCVDAFPLSTSRKVIMDGLRRFTKRLVDAGINGELWLDGSFLTEKIEPKDVDIVLRIQAPLYNGGNAEIRSAVDWVIANQKAALHCDSYALFEYPADDPLHEEGEWWYSYWHTKWGFSREEHPKGIVAIVLSGVAP